MSRKLNVAAILLFIVGAWMLMEGVMALFSPEWYLSMWIEMMNVELAPPAVSQIRDLGQNLLDFMTFMTWEHGAAALLLSLFICVTSLVPYRRGEKWAWYAMLVIGIIFVLWIIMVTYIAMAGHAPVTAMMVILWIVGLALPAKEILGKPP